MALRHLTAALSSALSASRQPDPQQVAEYRYDDIGVGYALVRGSDPLWQADIDGAIGEAHSVLNVGAGTGNDEPSDRVVVAVEPSRVMLHQRAATAAPAIQAVAEHLPFADGQFDVAMAILTVHHWSDPQTGLAERFRYSRF